ncbi:protein DpdD [Geodermatophilus sp. SYSU D01036]
MRDALDEFFGPGNDIKPANVDHTLQALLDSWRAGIRAGGVGFLPRGRQQRTYWYAFAPSARQRRELLALLDAWVGPTYSDLAQRRGALEPADAFDAALASAEVPPIRFEVLPQTAPHATQAKVAVRNALTMLTRLANGRPPSKFDALRTTVEVLDDLGHAIAARDGALATACMAELEQSADLDEANLAFLRIRVHAGMRDWHAVFTDPALEHVLTMRRPLGVTRAIQAALYFERFQDLDRAGSEPGLRASAEQLEPALRDLYTGAPPQSRAEAVVELVCRLLATASAVDPAIDDLIGVAATIQPGLDKHLCRIVDAFVPEAQTSGSTAQFPSDLYASGPAGRIAELMLQGQFAACIELGLASKSSVEAGRALVYAARQLSSVEWAAKVIDYLDSNGLREQVAATTPVLQADVQWLESIRLEVPAQGWREWFEMLNRFDAEPPRISASAIQSWEPLPVDKFVTLLSDASETTLTRLGDNGGQFLAAHSDLFDEPEISGVALRLVAAIALSGKASAGVRVQTLALVDSLDTADLERHAYEELLEWYADILGANVAATTVSWVCDVLAAVTSIPVPGSTEASLKLYFKAIEVLRPYRTALDDTDLETLDVVAAELGTETPQDFRPDQGDDIVDPAAAYRYLNRKTIVLHSLTETATTRASQVLRRFVPGIDVRTNSDHDGSPQLAQLSRNADVFVVVTASAKHAATTFIADHRGALPTVLVNSRGSSAILRALADPAG